MYRMGKGEMMGKTCSRCKKKYPATVEYFYQDKSHKDGLNYWCKECDKKYSKSGKGKAARKKYNESEKGKAYRKEYQESAKGKAIRQKANRRYDKSRKGKAYRQLYKYGITPARRMGMYLDQNGCCVLCGKAVPFDKIHTDHDHVTDKVRGLLCCGCNTGIGFIEKHKDNLEKFLEYLKEK